MSKPYAKILENRIKSLLSSNTKYQKSDLALMSRLWFDDINVHEYGNINSLSAINVLHMLNEGRLTSWDSATRCRRKLQAKFPELRNELTYKGRKNKEKIMRESKQYY